MLDIRFWSKVRKLSPTDCWEWTANKNNKGYGLFRPGGTAQKELAHRLSYENTNGAIPGGMHIMHTCDNPGCVNPNHLVAGTRSDNMTDCIRKGRFGGMVLSDALVIDLLRDYVSGMSRNNIASSYGISAKSVPDFVSGKSRKWLLGKHGCPTLEELKAARKWKPSAKITAKSVLDIRRRLANGERGKSLAVEYGLHYATISDIKLRKIWKDI